MKKIKYVLGIAVILVFTYSLILIDKDTTIQTSSQELSNKKIEWGIKRNDNDEQPDLGSTN